MTRLKADLERARRFFYRSIVEGGGSTWGISGSCSGLPQNGGLGRDFFSKWLLNDEA